MNIKVHQTASNGAYVLSTPARFSAASAKLRRLCARAVALTHRGNTVTTTSTARSHRAESFQPTGLSALAPVEIRKTRAFAKALAWLIASVTAVGALTFALHSAHSNEGTRKFALSVFALGAGGLAALTAHLSVTWILISCALTAPRHSSRGGARGRRTWDLGNSPLPWRPHTGSRRCRTDAPVCHSHSARLRFGGKRQPRGGYRQ